MSETPDTTEATPGGLLKQARERAGLSVEKVAKDLHLDTQAIQAIEVNRFKDLGAPVYAKGYLRKYAKLLGVTEEGVMQGYQKMGDTTVPDPVPVTLHAIPETRKPLPGWIWRTVIGLLVLAGLVTLLNLRDDAEVVSPTVVSTPAPVAQPDASTASPLAALPPTSATTASGTVTVEFKFSAESWVEVRDAENKQVLYELGAAGNTRQIQAVPPLRVVLGAANAVGVQVNSATVTVPEKAIDNGVARFVINANGMLE